MVTRLALAQINTTVGDLAGNRDKILSRLQEARQQNADIVIFPEMSITGYPPEDLLLKPDFIDAAMQILEELARSTKGLTAIVGTPYVKNDLFNAAAVLHDGDIAGVYYKQFLPNYGVFDENRYFRAGNQQQVFIRNGMIFGVSICEDIWYPDGPHERQASVGEAELLLNISSSPYHMGKGFNRERMLANRASENTAVVAYCNMVGGQDELVFDGQSLICSPSGDTLYRGKQFEEEMPIIDLDLRQVLNRRLHDPRMRQAKGTKYRDFERVELKEIPQVSRKDLKPLIPTVPLEKTAEVYQALVLGTRDYVNKNGFSQVVIGLSGGIDSSLTAVIAADALGAENVTGISMPTRYSSSHSLEDAEQLVENLKLNYRKVPIDNIFQAVLDTLAPVFEGFEPDVTEENIQARVRGIVLMAFSNKFGSMVLTTGNKSETGVGYSTLYGDTAGGFAVIKDVPKTLVYELCRYRNKEAGKDLIPRRVLEKPPSAELRPDQQDSDSLPDYNILDQILHAYVEESSSLNDIVKQGFDKDMVQQIMHMLDRNEYKRRQSPPGIKITHRAFGKDWRLPITNRYRS
jgi:NAD+ synthase (glutamine-hydrolysing)